MLIMSEIVFYACAIPSAGVTYQRCNAATFDVSSHQALHAIIGNTYGGTPGLNFAVPELEPIVINAVSLHPQITLRGYFPNYNNLEKLSNMLQQTTTIANNNNPAP
jgi:microcystin-dependent protein